MQKTSEGDGSGIATGVQRALLFVGDRLAVILFALFTCVLLISGVIIPKAFSEQEDPQFSKQDVTWYQQSVAFPVPSKNGEADSFQVLAIEVTPTPTPTAPPASAKDNDIWEKLAQCETHGNWSSDTGNGYYGGLQFSQGAWGSVGGTGNPATTSKDEQIMRGKLLQERRGWSPWGSCSKKLGLL